MAKKKVLNLEEKLEGALIPVKEQPHKIPDNWEWVKLGSIIKFSKNKNIQKELNQEDIVNYVDIDAIDNSKFEIREPKVKKMKDLSSRARRVLNKGDIIYSTVRPYLNNIAIVDEERENFIGSTGFQVFRPIEIDNKYIFHYLLTSRINGYYLGMLKGFNSPTITQDQFVNTPIPLPNEKEVTRIIAKIESMFDKIKQAKELISDARETFKNRRSSILHKAFTGELTKQWRAESLINNDELSVNSLLEKINEEKMAKWEAECEQALAEGKKKPRKPKIAPVKDMKVPIEEQPYELPEGWTWVRLGELAEYKKGPFGSSLTKAMFVPKTKETFKVYEQGNAIRKTLNYGNYYIDKDKYDSLINFSVEPGDIIVSCAGTIGETFILPKIIEKGIINQALMRVRVTNHIKLNYYLELFDFMLKGDMNKKAKGTAIKNIPPLKILNAMPFPLPPLSEQEEIVRRVEKLLKAEEEALELLKMEDQIELLEKSILSKAFRGELGTGDETDEPAMELLKRVLENN